MRYHFPSLLAALLSPLLLNVGPDRKGNILPSSVAVLKEVGATRKP